MWPSYVLCVWLSFRFFLGYETPRAGNVFLYCMHCCIIFKHLCNNSWIFLTSLSWFPRLCASILWNLFQDSRTWFIIYSTWFIIYWHLLIFYYSLAFLTHFCLHLWHGSLIAIRQTFALIFTLLNTIIFLFCIFISLT